MLALEVQANTTSQKFIELRVGLSENWGKKSYIHIGILVRLRHQQAEHNNLN